MQSCDVCAAVDFALAAVVVLAAVASWLRWCAAGITWALCRVVAIFAPAAHFSVLVVPLIGCARSARLRAIRSQNKTGCTPTGF